MRATATMVSASRGTSVPKYKECSGPGAGFVHPPRAVGPRVAASGNHDSARSGIKQTGKPLLGLPLMLSISSSAKTRTWNPPVNSRLLCQLSYRGSPKHIITSLDVIVKVRLNSRAVCGCGRDGAVCATPWPRSGGCARASRQSVSQPLPAYAPGRPLARSASPKPRAPAC
jgi:hypothetical protein